MYIKYKHILSVFIFLLITSCTSDDQLVQKSTQDPTFTMSLSIPQLKELATRSSMDANQIDPASLSVLVFMDDYSEGVLHGSFHCTANVSSLKGNIYNVSFVKPRGKISRILVMGNYDVRKLELQEGITTYQEFIDMCSFTVGENDLLVPMWGEITAEATHDFKDLFNPSSQIPVQMERSVAMIKVNIAAIASKYEVEKVYLSGHSTVGNIFMPLQEVTSVGKYQAYEHAIYIPAQPLEEQSGKQRTKIVLGVKDKISQETSFYAMEFRNMTQKSKLTKDYVPILANYQYNFIIESVHRKGWSCVEDAITYGSQENLNYTLRTRELGLDYRELWAHNDCYFSIDEDVCNPQRGKDGLFEGSVKVYTNLDIADISVDFVEENASSLFTHRFDKIDENQYLLTFKSTHKQTLWNSSGYRCQMRLLPIKKTILRELTVKPNYELYSMTSLDVKLIGKFYDGQVFDGSRNEKNKIEVNFDCIGHSDIEQPTSIQLLSIESAGVVFKAVEDIKISAGNNSMKVSLYPIGTVKPSKEGIESMLKFVEADETSLFKEAIVRIPLMKAKDMFRATNLLFVSENMPANFSNLYALSMYPSNYSVNGKTRISSFNIDYSRSLPDNFSDKYHIVFYLDAEVDLSQHTSQVKEFIKQGGYFIHCDDGTKSNKGSFIGKILGLNNINIEQCEDIMGPYVKWIIQSVDKIPLLSDKAKQGIKGGANWGIRIAVPLGWKLFNDKLVGIFSADPQSPICNAPAFGIDDLDMFDIRRSYYKMSHDSFEPVCLFQWSRYEWVGLRQKLIKYDEMLASRPRSKDIGYTWIGSLNLLLDANFEVENKAKELYGPSNGNTRFGVALINYALSFVDTKMPNFNEINKQESYVSASRRLKVTYQ